MGGELLGLGLRVSPSLAVENREGDPDGRLVGRTYGENRWALNGLGGDGSVGDLGDRAREEARRDVGAWDEAGGEDLRAAASRAGL